ncbi:MAG: heme-binding domain-containing protein [Sphingobacteriales bacterium]|nr:heme-binding domain-containing protein [Sphingobacteriales bacterium]
MRRKILLSILLALIVIQFFHPVKNQDAELLSTDITKVHPVPEDVLTILKTSCYDCHSNNTVYPWYNNIQPVAWWLSNHVKEGKEHLNFSDFGSYPEKKAKHKLQEVKEAIEENEMPLTSYTIIHRNAALNDAQKKLVLDWVNSTGVK